MSTEPEEPTSYIPLHPTKTPNLFLHGADDFGTMERGKVYNSITYNKEIIDINGKPIRAKKPKKKTIMPLQVITIPAQMSEEMDVNLLMLIKTANHHIELMAKTLKKSKVNDIKTADNREVIITLSVSPETGSIEVDRQFILP